MTTGVVLRSALAVRVYPAAESAATAIAMIHATPGVPRIPPITPTAPPLPVSARGIPTATATTAPMSCAVAATVTGRYARNTGAWRARYAAKTAARPRRSMFPSESHICDGSSITAAPITPAAMAVNFPTLGLSTPWNTAMVALYTGTSCPRTTVLPTLTRSRPRTRSI